MSQCPKGYTMGPSGVCIEINNQFARGGSIIPKHARGSHGATEPIESYPSLLNTHVHDGNTRHSHCQGWWWTDGTCIKFDWNTGEYYDDGYCVDHHDDFNSCNQCAFCFHTDNTHTHQMFDDDYWRHWERSEARQGRIPWKPYCKPKSMNWNETCNQGQIRCEDIQDEELCTTCKGDFPYENGCEWFIPEEKVIGCHVQCDVYGTGDGQYIGHVERCFTQGEWNQEGNYEYPWKCEDWTEENFEGHLTNNRNNPGFGYDLEGCGSGNYGSNCACQAGSFSREHVTVNSHHQLPYPHNYHCPEWYIVRNWDDPGTGRGGSRKGGLIKKKFRKGSKVISKPKRNTKRITSYKTIDYLDDIYFSNTRDTHGCCPANDSVIRYANTPPVSSENDNYNSCSGDCEGYVECWKFGHQSMGIGWNPMLCEGVFGSGYCTGQGCAHHTNSSSCTSCELIGVPGATQYGQWVGGYWGPKGFCKRDGMNCVPRTTYHHSSGCNGCGVPCSKIYEGLIRYSNDWGGTNLTVESVCDIREGMSGSLTMAPITWDPWQTIDEDGLNAAYMEWWDQGGPNSDIPEPMYTDFVTGGSFCTPVQPYCWDYEQVGNPNWWVDYTYPGVTQCRQVTDCPYGSGGSQYCESWGTYYYCIENTGIAGQECYWDGENPQMGICREFITASSWHCDSDWPSGDECHCTCTNGDHTSDNPHYSSGDCDTHTACEAPCYSWCEDKNNNPFIDQGGAGSGRTQKGGLIRRNRRR